MLVLGLTHCSQNNSSNQQSSAQKALDVDVVTLHDQSINMTTDLPGRTDAVKQAEVRPQVGGVILQRLFKEGSDVKAGQQLYQIDPASYKATRDHDAAVLYSARAQARRDKPLAAANAISQQDYIDAVATEREAAADLESANINLRYTQVRAPLSGTIGRSSVTAGALVTDGQDTAMATITQLDPIYVDVTEPYDDMLRMRRELKNGQLSRSGSNGAKVGLKLSDGSFYPNAGRLDFSEVSVDEGTGSVTVRATFPNPDHVLLPGMFVHARLNEGTNAHALLVPQKAVQHDTQGNAFVYVVDNNNQAKQVTVTAGQMMGQDYLISQGLSSGDRVITDNLQSLNAGQQVKASEVKQDARQSPSDSSNQSFNDPAAR